MTANDSNVYPFFIDYGVKATKFGAFKFNGDKYYVFLPIEIENDNFPNISFTSVKPDDKEIEKLTFDENKKDLNAFDEKLDFQPNEKAKKRIFYLKNRNPQIIEQFMKPLNFSIFDINDERYPKLLNYEAVIDDKNISNYQDKRIPAFYSMGHVKKLFSRDKTRPEIFAGNDNDFSLITMYLLKIVKYDLPPPLYQNPDPLTNRGRYAIEYFNKNCHSIAYKFCKHVLMKSDFYKICEAQSHQIFQIDIDSTESLHLYLVDRSMTDKNEIEKVVTTPFYINVEDPQYDFAISQEFTRSIQITSNLRLGSIYLSREAKFPVHVVIRSNMPIDVDEI